jgi:hypothetical protein
MTLSSSLDPNGASSTSEAIGTYSLNSVCSGNITVEFINGIDFLSNLSASNGVIYGTYTYNGSGAEKSGTYGLYVGGTYISSSIAVQGVPAAVTCDPVYPTYTRMIYGDASENVVTGINFVVGNCYTLTGVSTSCREITIGWPPSGSRIVVELETTDAGTRAIINLHFKNNVTGEDYYGFTNVEWIAT